MYCVVSVKGIVLVEYCRTVVMCITITIHNKELIKSNSIRVFN